MQTGQQPVSQLPQDLQALKNVREQVKQQTLKLRPVGRERSLFRTTRLGKPGERLYKAVGTVNFFGVEVGDIISQSEALQVMLGGVRVEVNL